MQRGWWDPIRRFPGEAWRWSAGGAALLLMLGLAGGALSCRRSSEPAPSASPEVPPALERTLTRIQQSPAPEGPDEGKGPDVAALWSESALGWSTPGLPLVREGDVVRPAAPTPNEPARSADVVLPASANAPFRLTDVGSGLSIEVQLRGASSLPAKLSNGWAIYPGAYQGGDLLQRVGRSGLEDWIWLERAPARPEVSYEIALGDGIAGLRLADGALHFQDASGTPRIIVAPPTLIDASGTRHKATFDVQGCSITSIDSGEPGPLLVPPGSENCVLHLRWKNEGVQYPALLDPLWVTGTPPRVLLIWDVQNEDTDSLITYLQKAGLSVELSATDFTGYDGTNPAPGGHDAVVLLDGVSRTADLPLAGQDAIAQFIRAGGGFVHNEWSAAGSAAGRLQHLQDFILFGSTGSSEGQLSLSEVAGQQSHPVLSKMPASFQFSGGFNVGHVRAVAGITPTVLMQDAAGNDAVAAATVGAGRVVGFHHAGNYGSPAYHTLADGDVEHLYLNAIGWTSRLMVTAMAQSGGCGNCGQLVNGTCFPMTGGTCTTLCNGWACDGSHVICPSNCLWGCCTSGTVCSGNGTACVLPSGSTCSVGSQCYTGICDRGFCCSQTCGGPCTTCSSGACKVMAAGQQGNPSCGIYLCNGTSSACPTSCTSDAGCVTGYYCDLSSQVCTPTLSLGATCSRSRMCTNGNCVDGACCSSGYCGSCGSCSLAGSAGYCSALPAGTTGSCGAYVCDGTSNNCPTTCTNDSVCVSGDYCDPSAHACWPKMAQGGTCTVDDGCISGHCADGYCCNSACNGPCDVCAASLGASANGTCSTPANYAGSPSCSPYVCDGTSASCPTSCTTEAQCPVGTYCNGGQCVTSLANGQACSRARQCLSGNCADGFCCNSACSGACDFCAASLGASADGACTDVAGSSGNPSCGNYLCTSTSASCPASCTSDTQCAVNAWCGGGQCKAAQANGATCTEARQCASGNCVDGYCCNTACSDGPCSVCSAALGAPANGTCGNGVGIAAGPSCAPYACDGTSPNCPTSCTSDAQCAPADWCNGSGQCVPAQSNGATCTEARQCASGSCADGFCCNTACSGACDFCAASLGATANGTCTDVPGSYSNPSCGNYLCTATSASCPTSCTSDAQCTANAYCSGGQCKPAQGNGASCTEGRQCGSGNCVNNFCCNSACNNGPCEVCSAALGAPANGICGNGVGIAAAPSCAPYACDGTASSCPTSCTSDTQCAPGDWCNSSGQCVPAQGLGAKCTETRQCGSGNCVDGVCCNTTCSGACDFCAASLGASADGTCSNVNGAAGNPSCGNYLCSSTSPNCPAFCTTDSQCAANAWCSGSQCKPAQANGASCSEARQCGSGNCVDGVCCNTACGGACDVCSAVLGASANGTCTAAPGYAGSPTCSPYVCDGTGTSCPFTCTNDSQCIAGDYCDATGQCVPHQGNGAACDRARECSSGFCADGYCCNTACSGACDFCSAAMGAQANGVCTNVAGVPGNASCGAYLCSGTSSSCPNSCTNDSQCAPGSYCAGGACVPAQGNGGKCSSSRQCANGFCVDGVCCNTSCGSACDVCSAGLGAAADGLCSPAPRNNPGSPSCAPYLCDGTHTTCPSTCTVDSDCASTSFCQGGICLTKYVVGTQCSTSGQCASNFCVDGVCCNTSCSGSCDSCNVPTSVGSCSPSPDGQQGSPSCGAYACNGKNTYCPTSCNSNLECSPGYGCIAHSCVPLLQQGRSCLGDQYCASGHCADGVCCDAACSGGCDVCKLALGATKDGTCTTVAQGNAGQNPSCNPYLCDGQNGACPSACAVDTDCAAGNYCSPMHECQPRQQVGMACSVDAQCTSGFCVDGVCCNSACTAQCEACNLPTNPGACTPVTGAPVGARPPCQSDGSSCGGTCNGRSVVSCTYPSSSTTCGPPTCGMDMGYPSPLCDGAGNCSQGAGTACTPYQCGSSACLSECATNADCVEGSFCVNGTCAPVLAVGSACPNDGACQSGHCVDGICCGSACVGACQRCDAPGQEGTCTTALTGTPSANGDCDPLLCNGVDPSCPLMCVTDSDCQSGYECTSGRCSKQQPLGASCTKESDCASGFCVDEVCCNTACSGSCASCAVDQHVGTCTFVTGAVAPGRTACNGQGVCGGACNGQQADCSYPQSATECAPAFCSNDLATAASVCDGAGACKPGVQTRCPDGCTGNQCAGKAAVTARPSCATTTPSTLALVIGLLLLLGRRRRGGA